MSQSLQSQPLLSPKDAADDSAYIPSSLNSVGEHAPTRRSTRLQLQSVLFAEAEEGVSGDTSPPPPLPGENATKRRLTHSTTRAGRGIPTPRQLATPATPITPSRAAPQQLRTGLCPTESALATPNPYTPLEDNEVVVTNAVPDEAAPAPDPNIPRAPTLGWESFVNSLDANTQRELGVVDEILISYANFAGDAFKTFDVDSARLMD